MINRYFLLIAIIFTVTSNQAFSAPSKKEFQNGEMVINNRILAKINGKVFSVMDLMKKLEVIFYREYPQYAEIPQAKYEFFSSSWRQILDELIDAELAKANAQEVKLTVSDGDVRQEIENVFGPNVVMNIDKTGMTYEDVFKILADDITVQRMTYGMAHVHAINRIGPQDVRKAYEEYCQKNPIEESWDYKVLTVKSQDPDKSLLFANLCLNLLQQDGATFDNLNQMLKEKNLLTAGVNITTSETLSRKISNVSDSHKEVLKTLQANTFSKPIIQESKPHQKQSIAKVFYIEKYTPAGVIPLKNIEGKLKNMLLDKAMQEETLVYRKKLRKRFGIDEAYLTKSVPENFEPFIFVSTSS